MYSFIQRFTSVLKLKHYKYGNKPDEISLQGTTRYNEKKKSKTFFRNCLSLDMFRCESYDATKAGRYMA